MKSRIRTHSNPLQRFPELEPPCWDEVFEDPSKPFAFEFGSSKGDFLIEYAHMFPERNILGTEVRKPLVENLLKRIESEELKNAHVLYGNIIPRFMEFIPPSTIEEIIILFPDPWVKKKHYKRRVVTEGFLDVVARILEPGRSIKMATDHEILFGDTLETLGLHSEFKRVDPEPLPLKSHWHKYCERTGRPIQFLQFSRR